RRHFHRPRQQRRRRRGNGQRRDRAGRRRPGRRHLHRRRRHHRRRGLARARRHHRAPAELELVSGTGQAQAADHHRSRRGGRGRAALRPRGRPVRARERPHRRGHRRHRGVLQRRARAPGLNLAAAGAGATPGRPSGFRRAADAARPGVMRDGRVESGHCLFRSPRMRSSLILLCAGSLLLAACSQAPAPDPDATASAPGSTPDHAFKPDSDADDLRVMVSTLASDEFEGRAPGSAGEEKTVAYIQAQYERIGLEPGGDNGSFFQTVPMVETTADESTVLRLDSNGQQRELKFGSEMVLGTRTGEARVSVNDSELVFVGYGVNAPEQDWNDYAGIDVKGKTVVILVNDPGFHAGDESLFDGHRMTYYGRWTYKFEEAARQGAAAALIIHDTEGASYGWDVVRNSWSGPQFDLRAED